MALDIKKQIDNIDDCLKWIKEYHPEHYDSRFLQLVECRKVLKRLKSAKDENPGIAAFGKSQVGKSYLIGSLLQDNGKPFMIKAAGKVYDFVENINPPSAEGGGVESTGVVSRFSSFKRHPERYNEDYPVLVKLFSLTDIILTLADDYYNDYPNFNVVDAEEVEALCERLEQEYADKPARPTSPITADDVLNMKDYCAKHINNAQAFNSPRVAFFDRVALLIERVAANDYIKVFSLLWKDNPNFNKLYNILFDTLRTFSFERYIYLPIESVLHGGVRENTIMSVQCLKILLDENSKIVTDVYLRDESGQMKKCATGMQKSRICAVCSEVVFKIEEKFLSSCGKYDFTYVGSDVSPRLNKGEIEMSMLRDNDLLDFPGARARENEDINKSGEESVLLNCFLRGKVAYLFNKYNEEMGINILLFCHHNKDNDVTFLYQLLEDWVKNYVGPTPEERRRKLEMTKVSPLFYIGTMFNLDLAPADSEVNNSEGAIDQRWNSRLETIMNRQLFHSDTVEWVRNWIAPGSNFNNSYLLRDYKFSWEKYKMYSGFRENNREMSMLMSPEYYSLMRQTFIKNKHVRERFADPAISWDTSASMNNDGTLYVMEQLAIVAERMDSAREVQFDEMTQKNVMRVYNIMKEYYVSDDTTELLMENVRKANGIFREIEFTCQERPDFFGHLLQALQFTEAQSFKEIHRIIPQLGKAVHDSDSILDYELIRKRCDNFEGCTTEADMWKKLIKSYRFSDVEEATEYLRSRKIDPKKLFKGETLKRKNSAIISDDVIKLWEKNISGVNFMNTFAGKDKMDEIALTNLVTCLINTAQSVGLAARIEREITDYVDILNTSNINEYLIADMIATTISDFVIDFGYRYLESDQLATSRRVAREQDLPCFVWTERERKELLEEDELTALFNEILSSTERYTPAYEANYNTWLEFMYIAFIANIDVPDYNHEANDELKNILESLKNN